MLVYTLSQTLLIDYMPFTCAYICILVLCSSVLLLVFNSVHMYLYCIYFVREFTFIIGLYLLQCSTYMVNIWIFIFNVTLKFLLCLIVFDSFCPRQTPA